MLDRGEAFPHYFLSLLSSDPSSLADHHTPSVPVCPSPRLLTGCPVPTVPPAGQSVPRLQTPLSDPSQPQPPLRVAKECPQSAKSPSGSRSGVRGSGGAAVRPLDREKKLKPVSAGAEERNVARQPKNSRQKSTNGWRPVGPPFHKKVFSVVRAGAVRRHGDNEISVISLGCPEGVRGDVWRLRHRFPIVRVSAETR